MSAAGAAIGAAAAGTAFSIFGLGALASYATVFAIGAGLSMVSRALMPTPNIGQNLAGRSVTVRQPDVTRKIIYGQARVGGAIVYLVSTGPKNEYLHLVMTVAGHEIESFEEMWFNDDKVWDKDTGFADDYGDYVLFNRYLGNQTTVDPDLDTASAQWTSAHVLNGVAYAMVRLKYDVDQFAQGLPNISFVIKGKKVYNPITDVTEWTQNPALCVYDYLLDSRYGLAESPSNVNLAALTSAVNLCDQLVAESDNQIRYTLDGVVDSANSRKENIESMLSAMGGSLVYSGGQYFISGSSYVAPTITIDESVMVGAITVSTRKSRRELYNGVKGVFLNAEENYTVADYPAQISSDYAIADGDPVYLDMGLAFTTNQVRAQRLAKLALLKSRQQTTINVPCNLAALKFKAGDNINVTNTRLGWTNKPFQILGYTLNADSDGSIIVDVSAIETSPELYDWQSSDEKDYLSAGEVYIYDGKTTVAPSSVTATPYTFLAADGTVESGLDVSFPESNDAFVEYYRVEWRTGAEDWQSITTKLTSVQIANLESDVLYDVRVIAVNQLKVDSAPTYTTATTAVDVTPPALPSNLSAVGGLKQIVVTWDNPADTDFKHVQVFAHTSNSIPATPVALVDSESFVLGDLAADDVRYFWLKSVDFTGNVSVATDSINATVAQAATSDIEDEAVTFDKIDVDSIFANTAVINSITSNAIDVATLNANNISSTTSLTVGTGNNVGVISGEDDIYRIWAGNQAPASAPFSVDKSGNVILKNIYLSAGGIPLIDQFGFTQEALSQISATTQTEVNTVAKNFITEDGSQLMTLTTNQATTVSLKYVRDGFSAVSTISGNQSYYEVPLNVTLSVKYRKDGGAWNTISQVLTKTAFTSPTATQYQVETILNETPTSDRWYSQTVPSKGCINGANDVEYFLSNGLALDANATYDFYLTLDATVDTTGSPDTIDSDVSDTSSKTLTVTVTSGSGFYVTDGAGSQGTTVDADTLGGQLPSHYASTSYVGTAISNLVDSSPATLDTLNELAAALGDDPNFATTVSNSIGTKWTQDNTKISNWDTAFGWGDHATAGYLTSVLTPVNGSWWNSGFVKVGADGVMEVGKYLDFHTSNSGGNVDYDLRVIASPGALTVAGTISATGGNSTNWNTAYGWGNHATAGYLTSVSGYLPLAGGTLTDELTTDDIVVPASKRLKFGASATPNFEIYASGTGTVLHEQGAGNIDFIGDNMIFRNPNSGTDIDYYAKFTYNGSAALYYDGTKVFETTSTGIDVTGTATMDGLSVVATAPNVLIQGVSATDASLTLSSVGITSWALRNESTDSSLYFTQDGTTRARLSSGGDISFYDDSGNAKLFWDASAESLGIGTSSLVAKMHLKGAGTSSSTNAIFAENSSSAGLFAIRDNGDAFILGNTGIGTSSPSAKLSVSNNGAGGLEFTPSYSGTRNLILNYNRSASSYTAIDFDATDYIFYGSGSERMRVDNAGAVTAYNSFRAPIFYDSNDTGYYVDPNTTSNLNTLQANLITSQGFNIQRKLYAVGSTASAGWYRVAQRVGSSGRGAFTVTLFTTGGSYAPRELIITGHTDWSSNATIHSAVTNTGGTSWSQVRIVREGGNSYLEANFNLAITDLSLEMDERAQDGWTLLSGVLPAATGTESSLGIPVTLVEGLAMNGFINSPSGFVSTPNPWQTANSAFFPNGITTAGGANWIYGHTYLGNAPSNGAGHEARTTGTFISTADHHATLYYDYNDTAYYVDPNGASNLGGISGTVLTVTKASGANGVGSLFQNQNGDNSWGIVSEFRVANAVGTDRPSILFSTAYNTNTWSVGYGYVDDNFRIKMDHGHRNGGWGTDALLIDRSSNVTASGSSRAPIFYDSANTGYYLDPNGASNFNALNVGSYPVFTSARMEATRNIVSGTNLDTDLESGGTYCSYGSANTSWNAPNSYGGVIGTAFGSGIRGQMFYDIRHNTNNYSDLWFRSKNNLGWQPWARVWHSLNDGAGSGLDADLLDGMQAAQSGASVVLNTASNGYLYINNWIHPANGTGLFYDAGVHFYESGNYMYSTTGIRAAYDMRAPIFHDLDNTAYYADPNSTSRFARIVQDERYDATNIATYGGFFTGDWQSLTNSIGQFNVVQVNDINGGAYSNQPPNVYTYGSILSWRALNHSFQLYAAHTGDLAYKTQWNNDNYTGWLYPMVYNRNNGGGGTVYGSLFYDSDNTAYYVDPNGTSSLNLLNVNTSGAGNGSPQQMASFVNVGTGATSSYATFSASSGVDWRVGKNPAGTAGNTNFGISTHVGALVHQWDGSGNSYASGSSRAPIFYDSDNTNYYLNPNNTSNLNALNVSGLTIASGGITVGQSSVGYNQADTFTYDGIAHQHYGVTFKPSKVVMSGYSGLGLFTQATERLSISNTGIVTIQTDIRSPIFYDSNDTNYYVDPNSTSVLNLLHTARYGRTAHNSGYLVGGYNNIGPSGGKSSPIYSIGSAYAANDTNLGNLYGIGYSTYSSTLTGVALTGATDWGMYVAANGLAKIWLDGYNGNISAYGSSYAQAFYDSNDTAYYVDPNGTTAINSLVTDDYIRIRGNKGIMGDYDTEGTASKVIWTIGASWPLANMYGIGYEYGSGYDHHLAFRNNGVTRTRIGFDVGMLLYGTGTATSDWRAPIFYDSNDTAYYVDPASNSVLNTITVSGGGSYFGGNYFNSNSGGYSGTLSGPALQVYAASGNSAFMSFHRGGYYAVNMGLDADNVLRIGGWSAAANLFQMDMSGNLTMSGNITAYSDIRLKDNIEVIPDALAKVQQLRGVTFTRNDVEDLEKRHTGVIAQEVEAVLPEAVSEDNDGIKNVAYGNMVGLLIEAIKELKTEVDNLKTQLAQKEQ